METNQFQTQPFEDDSYLSSVLDEIASKPEEVSKLTGICQTCGGLGTLNGKPCPTCGVRERTIVPTGEPRDYTDIVYSKTFEKYNITWDTHSTKMWADATQQQPQNLMQADKLILQRLTRIIDGIDKSDFTNIPNQVVVALEGSLMDLQSLFMYTCLVKAHNRGYRTNKCILISTIIPNSEFEKLLLGNDIVFLKIPSICKEQEELKTLEKICYIRNMHNLPTICISDTRGTAIRTSIRYSSYDEIYYKNNAFEYMQNIATVRAAIGREPFIEHADIKIIIR